MHSPPKWSPTSRRTVRAQRRRPLPRTSRSRRRRAESALQRAVHVALRVAFREVLALVPELLAASKSDLHLDAVANKVETQRDDRQPLRVHARVEVLDLSLVQQQPA